MAAPQPGETVLMKVAVFSDGICPTVVTTHADVFKALKTMWDSVKDDDDDIEMVFPRGGKAEFVCKKVRVLIGV